MEEESILLLCAILYLVVTAGISRYVGWKYHPVKKIVDYTVGGRQVGLTLMAATFVATWCSSYTIFACGETSYTVGLSGMIWYPVGVAGPVLATFAIARWVKRKVPAGWTLGDYVGTLWGTRCRLIVAGIVILAMLFEVTAAIFAGSSLVHELTGFPVILGALILGGTFIFYTTLGGLWAVLFGDLIRVCTFLLIGLVAVPILLSKAGGFSVIYNALPPNFFDVNAWGIADMQNFWLLLFGYTAGSAAVWQRVFAARDEEVVEKGFLTFALGWFPFAICGGILGMLARVVTTEEILPAMAVGTTVDMLAPFGLEVLLLIGLLAVITSSADSFFNAAVSTWVIDFEHKTFRRGSSDKVILRDAKIFALLFGAFAIFCAGYVRSIINLLQYNSYIFMGIVFVICASVFWDKMTRNGAFIGMIGGLTVSLGGYVLQWPPLLATLLSVGICAVLSVGISLIDREEMKITYSSPPEISKRAFSPKTVYIMYAILALIASYPLWTALIWGSEVVIAPFWLTVLIMALGPIGCLALVGQLVYYGYRDLKYVKEGIQ